MVAFPVGALLYAMLGSPPEVSVLPIVVEGEPAAVERHESIDVVTWNIGYGHGIKPSYTDSVDQGSVDEHLNGLVDGLRHLNADVVLLQEVDLASSRTFDVDQGKWVAEKAGYPWRACASVWRRNFVPWPPTRPVGRVDTGMCVLSRLPLSDHRRWMLTDDPTRSRIVNAFYVDRGAQSLVVHVGAAEVQIVNVHLDARSRTARKLQVEQVLSSMPLANIPSILGGDFNALPAEAPQKSGFPDEPAWDGRNDSTLAQVQSAGFSSTASMMFTFPSNRPNRQLDHLFARGTQIGDVRVADEVGTPSDHLPLVGRVRIR